MVLWNVVGFHSSPNVRTTHITKPRTNFPRTVRNEQTAVQTTKEIYWAQQVSKNNNLQDNEGDIMGEGYFDLSENGHVTLTSWSFENFVLKLNPLELNELPCPLCKTQHVSWSSLSELNVVNLDGEFGSGLLVRFPMVLADCLHTGSPLLFRTDRGL